MGAGSSIRADVTIEVQPGGSCAVHINQARASSSGKGGSSQWPALHPIVRLLLLGSAADSSPMGLMSGQTDLLRLIFESAVRDDIEMLARERAQMLQEMSQLQSRIASIKARWPALPTDADIRAAESAVRAAQAERDAFIPREDSKDHGCHLNNEVFRLMDELEHMLSHQYGPPQEVLSVRTMEHTVDCFRERLHAIDEHVASMSWPSAIGTRRSAAPERRAARAVSGDGYGYG